MRPSAWPHGRTHVRYQPTPGIERVFGWQGRRVAPEEDEMELMIKVMLVGYVLYAVLGAPMLSPARDEHRA